MSNYEKHVLQGVLAGLITGLVLAVIVVMLVPVNAFESLTEEVVRKLLQNSPTSEVEKAIENLKKTLRAVYWVTPVSNVLQHLLIGALFGLVKGVFRERFKLGELQSSLVAGVLYLVLMSVAPLATLLLLVNLLEYPILLVLTTAPGITYTALLALFNARRGPWSKIVEAKPKVV